MPETAAIACSEVWGGNRLTHTALSLPGIEGWVTGRPHRGAAAGGDLHYVSSCGTGRITRVLLADIAGHGDAAAPLAEVLRRIMQRYMNHIEPRKLAAALNRDLAAAGQASGAFVTAIVMTFFAPNGRLTICNAGHPEPAVYRADKRRWTLLKQHPDDGRTRVTNLPLGVLEDAGYTGRQLVLEPGDSVLLYSDCLIEACRPDRRQLGYDGLLSLLNGTPAAAAGGTGDFIDALLSGISTAGYALDDDMTIVLLRCTERSAGAPLPKRLAGMARSALQIATSPSAAPWPELSKANVLGPVMKRFQR